MTEGIFESSILKDVYVGFYRELNGDYEIEFYIAKNYRRKGYCEEACKAVIKQIFGEGLSVDHNLWKQMWW